MQGGTVDFLEPFFRARVQLGPDFTIFFQQVTQALFYGVVPQVASVGNEPQLEGASRRRQVLLDVAHAAAYFGEFLYDGGFAVARKAKVFKQFLFSGNVLEKGAVLVVAGFVECDKVPQLPFHSLHVYGDGLVVFLRPALAVSTREGAMVVGIQVHAHGKPASSAANDGIDPLVVFPHSGMVAPGGYQGFFFVFHIAAKFKKVWVSSRR